MHSDAGSNGCDGDNDTSREDSPSNLYAPAKYVPDRTVRQPMTDDNRGGTRGELEDLNDAMEELRQLQADRYDTVEDFEGRADWDKDWTLISSGREKEHDTTLVALEKDFKSVPEHKKKDNGDEDDGPDTTLDDFNDDERYRMVEKEVTDEYEPEHIVRVQEIGYRIHDRVIRPARVVVAKPESQ